MLLMSCSLKWKGTKTFPSRTVSLTFTMTSSTRPRVPESAIRSPLFTWSLSASLGLRSTHASGAKASSMPMVPVLVRV